MLEKVSRKFLIAGIVLFTLLVGLYYKTGTEKFAVLEEGAMIVFPNGKKVSIDKFSKPHARVMNKAAVKAESGTKRYEPAQVMQNIQDSLDEKVDPEKLMVKLPNGHEVPWSRIIRPHAPKHRVNKNKDESSKN